MKFIYRAMHACIEFKLKISDRKKSFPFLQSGKILNLAHYFPYDVKPRLLAHSRSFLANQKLETLLGRFIMIQGKRLVCSMKLNACGCKTDCLEN